MVESIFYDDETDLEGRVSKFERVTRELETNKPYISFLDSEKKRVEVRGSYKQLPSKIQKLINAAKREKYSVTYVPK